MSAIPNNLIGQRVLFADDTEGVIHALFMSPRHVIGAGIPENGAVVDTVIAIVCSMVDGALHQVALSNLRIPGWSTGT